MTAQLSSSQPARAVADGGEGAAGRLRRGRDLVVRHPVASVVVVALVVRVALAVVISQMSGGGVFEDDGTYTLLAEQKATGATQRWSEYEYFLYDATGTLMVPLTWLFSVFGPHAFLGQMLVVGYAVVAAGAVVRLGLEALPVGWAVGAGLVVALLPSQVLFSSLVLKDAAVWAVLALLALTVSLCNRHGGRRLLLAVAAVGVLYVLLAHLRVHTLVAACWAASLAALLAPGPDRLRRASAVVLLSVIVPMLYGLGPAGLRLATDAAATLEARRTNNAVGAATAFVPPPPKSVPTAPSATPLPAPEEAGAAPPPPPADEPSGGTSLHALRRGLSVMLLEPYPTVETFQNRRVALALAENVVWWPLLLLAAFGLRTSIRNRAVVAFPVLAGGAVVLLYALSEGNFGTAYRHRGEVVWAVALLAAFGAHELHAIRKRRSITCEP